MSERREKARFMAAVDHVYDGLVALARKGYTTDGRGAVQFWPFTGKAQYVIPAPPGATPTQEDKAVQQYDPASQMVVVVYWGDGTHSSAVLDLPVKAG